jgi:hypothetical protein
MPMQRAVNLKGVLLAVPMAAGMSTSLALAERPGNGKGAGHDDTTTTTTPANVTLCHRTGSPKHPFVKISVPPDVVWTHVKRGDVLPSASGACPIRKHPKHQS